MGLKIYDRNGGLRIEVQPSDSSSQTAELQGDDVLSMSFTHYGYVGLEVDDYVDFEGVRYRMTERYRPKQKSAMEWEYSIKLYGPESLLRDVLVIKNFEGEQEAEFTLTAPPGEHVALVVSALNGDNGSEWKRGTVTGTENITIDYFGKYCDEALREIAEKAGTEYWTDGTTVNVCRCEHGEPLTLGLADGLTRIEPATAGNVKFYTRLFPMGSTRNIDAESYGHRRLQLPDGAKYVEINADRYRRKDHYEEAAFADIYPRYTGTVSSVRSETRKGADGEDFTVYYFKDDALPFNPDDYLMAGKVMRISFQEGSDLGGLGDEDNGTYYFEANWHADTGEFELITIWPYRDSATQLPGGVLVPKAGDKYIPWNIRMPQEYYTLAEAEFAAAVQKYNADHDVDLTVFKAQTDHVWVEDNGADLFVGRRVRLVSDRYFPATGYRDSRITKISRKINLPTQMEVEIGDALGRSSKTKITDDIRDARDYARSIGNSVSLPDIIRTGDTTRPTDNNLMSALRIIKDFLCKYKDDRTAHKLATDKAFEVGEFLAGISGGFFGIDENGDSYLEVARLYARVRAVFEELTVIKTGVLAGKQYITPGGGIVCTKVEEVTNASGTLTGWRCYFLSEQDGEKTECKFRTNDQAISALFNAKTGTANKVSNHRYWRLVTAVDNDACTDGNGNHYGYIELSATDCEAGSDTPQAGDEICQFGYRGTDEPRRQSAMVFSTVDADAPSIKLFRGINSYTLDGKAVVQFGVDAQSGKVFFRLGASDATHFLDYTEAGGLQVAGKISTLSTLDDSGTTLGAAINSKVEDTDVLWRLHTSQTDAPALPVLGADGTITDFKGWQTDAPAAEAGKFVWTTTYVRYGNGTAKFDGTACVTGRDGKDGKDGKDAVAMTSEVAEYAIGTSGTVAPTSGWGTTIPAVPKGQYQWTRVTTKYSDGTSTVSYSVAYIPKDGEDGVDGSNYTPNLLLNSAFLQGLDKWTGWSTPPIREVVDIDGKKWLHVKTNSGNFQGVFQRVATNGQSGVYTFSALVRGAAAGQQFSIGIHFINSSGQIGGQAWNHWTVGTDMQHVSWQCTIPSYAVELSVMVGRADAVLSEIYYTDLKLEVGANPSPVWSPAPSEQLGVTIASESVTYAKNTTGIQPADASFTATSIGGLGTISGGDYVWSKTAVTYTDGTVLKSYAVSRIGSDGETQIAGLHIAYATGITGSLPHPTAVTGFSTTMVAGVEYKYIGIRKDNQAADSTNFADYDWAEFRGNDGQNGASYTSNMLVGTRDWSGAIQKSASTATSAITTELHNGLTVMTTGNKAWQCYYFNLDLEAGKEYTISADAFCTEQNLTTALNSGYWGLSFTSKVTVIDEHVTTILNSWSRVWLRFRCTKSGNGAFGFENGTTTPIKFAGMKLEEGLNDAPTWSPHPSEMVGTPAKVVIVNAPQLVFTYENNFATIVGAQQIVIQSTLQGTTGRQWSYRPGNASGFTDYPGATGETFTVPHNHSTYFPNGAKSCTFRCTSGGVYDEVTISKVSSGSKGEGYTPNLLKASNVQLSGTAYFLGKYDWDKRPPVGTVCTLTVCGKIGSKDDHLEIHQNNGWKIISDFTSRTEAISIYRFTIQDSTNGDNSWGIGFWHKPNDNDFDPDTYVKWATVTVGDTPQTEWIPAASEMVGEDAITVILTNESHVFEGDTEKAKTGSTECGVIAYKGATQVAATIGPITGAPAGMDVSIQNNTSTSAKFTVAVTSAMTDKQGVLTIPVTVDGKSFTKKFSWSVSLQGKDGRGIASVQELYAVSSSNTTAPADSAFSTGVKTTTTTNRYLWNYEKTTYTDGTSASTEKRVIGTHGANGEAGAGISSIVNRYLASAAATGVTTSTSGWTTDPTATGAITTDAKPYLWNYETVNYTKGNPTTTTPRIIGTRGRGVKKLTEEYALSNSETVAPTSGWSSNKQPWEAGKFYWTRIRIEYTDGTIETTTPICATGTPALRLDLTNEMAGVACNASGTPVSGALPVKSTAVVYKGGGIDSGWSFSKAYSGCGSSINDSTGDITVDTITADKATVTVTAKKAGHADLTTTMNLWKVKPGADGQPATVFQVEPNVNVIKRDMAGTPHPTTLTVKKYRTTGAATRVATTEHYLYAWQTDANGTYVMSPVVIADTTQSSAEIPIAPTAVEVGLELRPVANTNPNVPVLDRETVPVMTDVADMEVATRNLLLSSGDWNMPDGVLISDDWWWDDLSMTGSNGNLKMTCNATSGNRAAYEKLSIRKAAEGTTMTLRVKGTVSGRTSGHIYFQLVSNWAAWQTVGQVAANGEFDLTKTFKLTDEWNGDTILAYGFGNANSGISLELEHAGLYIGNVIPTQWTAAPEDGNYLLRAIQRAKQDSTEIDGGLILAALLRLGITGSDGVRKIMAGLNGNGESRDALAAFFGGDLIDAAQKPTDENRARAGIRHDGTAYFCDNVVRMLENSIELGDSIKFDIAGMKLIGPDKRVRMSITNEMLSDSDVASAASYVSSWSGSFSAQSIRIGSRSQVTRPNGMIQQGATGITQGATWTYNLGSRTANSVLNGTVSLSLGMNMNNIPESQPWIGGGLKVEIFYTANSKENVVFSGSSTFYTDPTTGKGTVLINATLPVTTTYTLRVTVSESTGIIAIGTARSITPTASGQVVRGASDMIKHASNGIVAILGNMRFLMRENYFGVQVSAGFGAQLTPNGIYLKLGSTSWQLLTKASDGTLKLT